MKYRVIIKEEITYCVDVEANSEDEAGTAAIEELCNSESSDEYFVAVDERDVTSITRYAQS